MSVPKTRVVEDVPLRDPLAYFSDTFAEADKKFVAACDAAGGAMSVYDHPLKGRFDEPLRAVVCVDAPHGLATPNVLLTYSGTHGIEGYAGSMAQLVMLRLRATHALPATWRAVHVHMINPFGASWVLKQNEDNADQYKNASELYAQDIDDRIMVEFIDALRISELADPAVMQVGQKVMAGLIKKYGLERFMASLKQGQGKRPKGFGYFGEKKSWSSEVGEDVVRKHVHGSQRVVFIDWHTAVGEYGTWTVLAQQPEVLSQWQGWMRGSPTVVQGTSVPTGNAPGYGLSLIHI